ncbi:ArdC family protein [Stenotrophomonas sepilia]|uniref:ArdC family protein n=1 Tax=Stenotrophomonas sepilia TaxID=2860290 RepID=UPI002E76799D|nr:zincin-like metallopeptidase domain-containing protein [Stenotrophomonas sepilia]
MSDLTNESFLQRHSRDVVERLIRQMEEGTGPFVQPWDARVDLGLPMNPTTGKSYRGGNLLHLWALQNAWDVKDNRWMTYKQASSVGAQVRKGEKASVIEYWDWSPVEEAKKTGDPELIAKAHPKVFFPRVFNASQIDGLPDLVLAAPRPELEIHQACEKVIEDSGAEIHHDGGNQAFYRPMTDSIHMPERNTFHSASGYYATALHELAHWSGFPSRLNRPMKGGFGSEDYAKEELVAEVSSMLMGERLGIGHDPGQHAAYVKHWIKILRDDPREIFRAAAAAERVVEFLKVPELVHEPLAKVEREQTSVAANRQELEKPNDEKVRAKGRAKTKQREHVMVA